MMRRWLCLLLGFILLLLPSCATPAPPKPDELVDVYLAIIDTMFNEDTALNGSKYLAVDTSGMENLDRAAKDKLLKAVEKYGRTVMEDTMDGLEAKGYIKNLRFDDGVVFILKDKPPVDGVVTVEAEKWENGAGADFCKFDLKKKDGVWQIVKRYNEGRA